MLLEFRVKNYKVFRDELVFSMTPAPKITDLKYSLLVGEGKKFSEETQKQKAATYKALCSAVVYGPNASGKSSVFSAMEVMQAIVKRGHIKDDKEMRAFNHAKNFLTLAPNTQSEDDDTVDFALKFFDDGFLVEYELSIHVGGFLAAPVDRKIALEALSINGASIFVRRDDVIQVAAPAFLSDYFAADHSISESFMKKLAGETMERSDLFLANGFRTIFSPKLADFVRGWIDENMVVIYHANKLTVTCDPKDIDEQGVYVPREISDAVKTLGAVNEMGYSLINGHPELVSVLGDGLRIPSSWYESYGTLRAVNLFPAIIAALQHGSVLVVDEFDASIHPMALMSIIKIFHNDDINTKGAQLIFNTHNPIFLNDDLFRRDEIKFVERDEITKNSILYSLSDFGTSGSDGVRKGDNYMRNYFVNQYGAIRDIDFAPLLDRIVNHR